MIYTLTATRGADTETTHLDGNNDFSATLDAISLILDRATASPLWAYGRISLANPIGEVIHAMDEKDAPLCQAELRPATRVDQAVMCEDDAELGRNYCPAHVDWDEQ
jgi:hypothetical protein